MENIELINGKAAYPTPTVGGPLAPSCYRVSQLSGAIEVTARLKCGDDLDLILKVLEAHRPHFAKMDRLCERGIDVVGSAGSHSPTVCANPW